MSELYAKPATLRAANLNDLAALLKDQRARALDVVAPATALSSRGGLLVVEGTEADLSADGVTATAGTYQLTKTAEGGLADKLNIPGPYLRRMRETGRFDLYDANLNGWLHGGLDVPGHFESVRSDQCACDAHTGPDPNYRKFLVRILRGDGPVEHEFSAENRAEGRPADYMCGCAKGDLLGPCEHARPVSDGYVRAVLSDTYKVIDSLDVLLATLDGIREAGVTVDVRECDLTESKMYVKLWSPQVAAKAPELLAGYRSPFEGGAMRFGAEDGRGWDLQRAREAARREGLAFEPGAEPVVFAGFVISNSETGQGRFQIAPQIVVQVCGNGLTITGDAIAKTHLGGKLDEGRIRWSDDTEAANLALIRKQTRDAVRNFLSADYVQAKVDELAAQAGAPVDNAKDAVQLVAKKLAFSEREADSILGHFLLGGQRSAGGLMQAVSSVAQTVADGDRAAELEAQAVPAMQLVCRPFPGAGK